jgi:hypothetical protein
MNGELRTDLIQLITRTESLSGDDDSQARRPTLMRHPSRLIAINPANAVPEGVSSLVVRNHGTSSALEVNIPARYG